jgi:hypothetical protein
MRANVAGEGVLGIKDATTRAEPIKELAGGFAATLLDGCLSWGATSCSGRWPG